MAMLSQILSVARNFDISHDRLFDQVWGKTLPP